MTNNEHMISMLTAYLDFAKDTTNNPYHFSPHVGLCGAVFDYCYVTFTNPDKLDEVYFDLEYMLHHKLIEYTSQISDYPFGKYDYLRREAYGTQHKCTNRIVFVQSYLNELKGQL